MPLDTIEPNHAMTETSSIERVCAARDAARGKFGCEVDGNSTVSISEDGGAHVQAWVWIPDESAGVSTDEDGSWTVLKGGE